MIVFMIVQTNIILNISCFFYSVICHLSVKSKCEISLLQAAANGYMDESKIPQLLVI